MELALQKTPTPRTLLRRAIDQATLVPSEPVVPVRPGVHDEFAAPELEARPALQEQSLRTPRPTSAAYTLGPNACAVRWPDVGGNAPAHPVGTPHPR